MFSTEVGSTTRVFSGSRLGLLVWVFPKIGVFPPQIIHFDRDFHYFHHPFLGYPYFWKHPHRDSLHVWRFGKSHTAHRTLHNNLFRCKASFLKHQCVWDDVRIQIMDITMVVYNL